VKSVSKMQTAEPNINCGKCACGKGSTEFVLSRGLRRIVQALSGWSMPHLNTRKEEPQGIKMKESSMSAVSHLTVCATKNALIGRAAATFSLLFLAALILIPTSAAAQTGGTIPGQIVTPFGAPAAHARLTFCAYSASGIPCSPQATIYSDPGLTQQLTQPYAADQFGNFTVWVAQNACYQVQAAVNQTTTYIWTYCVGSTSGGGGGGSPGGPTNSVQVNVNGVFVGYSTLTYTPSGGLLIGNAISGNTVTIGPQIAPPASWIFNDSAPCTAWESFTSSVGCTSAYNVIQPGPHYYVTDFGAVGDDQADDTVAIQSAFNACWNGGSFPGGTVEFPAVHTYKISSTINTYDSCKFHGGDGSVTNDGQTAIQFRWNGPAQTTSLSVSGFCVQPNSSATTCGAAGPYYPPHSPAPVHTNFPYTVTFTVSNSLSVGNWVYIQGFSANGVVLNRVVAQVAYATSSVFVVGIPFTPLAPLTGAPLTPGPYTDSGTVMTVNVPFAFDDYARNQQEISNINLNNQSGLAQNARYFAGFWFPRQDTGSRIYNVAAEGSTGFGFYYANGGINYEIGEGSRCDSGLAQTTDAACVYWRLITGDNLHIHDASMNTSINGGGAALMIDASSCDLGTMNASVTNVDMESDAFTIAAGLGNITFYDCGGSKFQPQLTLYMEGQGQSQTGGTNNHGIVVSPPSDTALALHLKATQINGHTPSGRFFGMPAAARDDMAPVNTSITGGTGYYSTFDYSPSVISNNASVSAVETSPGQIINDFQFSQLWQHTVQASAFLLGDTAFAAFPSGTTLFSGQVIAPPQYWGANGKRYALYTVYQSGTTGTLSGVTCAFPGIVGNNDSMTCSTSAGLSIGQFLTVAGIPLLQITGYDATNPSAVFVQVNANISGIGTGQAASYTAPVLGPEIQLPTKSAAAPTSLAWLQGDMEQNSGATANGIAAWVDGTVSATATANLSGGGVSTVTVNTGGGPYPSAPTVQFSGGGGSGATATAVLTTGVVSSITVVSAGTGYTSAPTVSFLSVGTWAAVPLGNASGQLAPAQIGTGTPSASRYVDGGTGAWTALPNSTALQAKFAGPVANTGNTTQNLVGSIAIPAGLMGANSQINLTIQVDACDGTPFPTSACTSYTNTGTCSYSVYLYTAASVGGNDIMAPTALPAAAVGTLSGTIINTALATQIIRATMTASSGGGVQRTTIGTINTANAFYANIFVQNSVSADSCFVDGANAVVVQ
jgi:Pectate lyase superfamily protein